VQQNENNGGDIVMDILSASADELIFGAVDAVLMVASVILLSIACIRFLKTKSVPGAKWIFFSLAGYLGGFALYLVYTAAGGGDESSIVESLSSLYFSACMVAGAYGLFAVSKFVGGLNANQPFKRDALKRAP
jgi:uncharacterized membrane protein